MAATDRIKFGKAVRRLRAERGWTQEQLSERARLHPTYIGSIERGERNVGFDNILRLARAFGVQPGMLFAAMAK